VRTYGIDENAIFTYDTGLAIGGTVKDLHKLGARKFVHVKIPAVGCSPTALSEGGYLSNPGGVPPVVIPPVPVGKQCYIAFNEIAAAIFVYVPSTPMTQYPNSVITYADLFTVTLGFHNHNRKRGYINNYPCCGAGFNKAQVRCGTTGTVNGKTLYGAACPRPSQHWSWDGLGLTQAANKQIAKEFWSGSSSIMNPINISQIAAH